MRGRREPDERDGAPTGLSPCDANAIGNTASAQTSIAVLRPALRSSRA